MKTKSHSKPVDLNVFQVKLPTTAFVSIMHRLSGLLLFLCIPWLLWCLSQSLDSPARFNHMVFVLDALWLKSLLWFILSAFFYHLMGGIRHIVLEMDLMGESLLIGRSTAYIVIVVSVIFALMLGVRLR